MTLVGTGTLLAAILGMAHAVYVFTVVASHCGTASAPRYAAGLYAGVWTLFLWLLFGTYLLLFWLLGAALYLLWGRRR